MIIILSHYFRSLNKWEAPTQSHGNSYVFYEVANSYEFVRPHSYDLVRFV